jgi:hypothetical protein
LSDQKLADFGIGKLSRCRNAAAKRQKEDREFEDRTRHAGTMRLSRSSIFDAIPSLVARSVMNSLLLRNQRRSSHGARAGIGVRHTACVALVGGGRVGRRGLSRDHLAAFGFVYIHPLADGIGRVHRFLINDVLRRDGAVPDPIILPVSAVITDDAGERRAYYCVLDRVSKPLMQSVREHGVFEPVQTVYSDGVVPNFSFGGADLAKPMWSYPDLGRHVIYLSGIISRTLTEQMREESIYLRRHAQARATVKEIVKMPDHQIGRVLRSIEQNTVKLSNVLAKEMPALRESGVWEAIVAAASRVWVRLR